VRISPRQPTEVALVHEADLKLVDQTAADWHSRTQFFAVAAQAMRRILVDKARRHGAAKRGGGQTRVDLDETLIAGFQPNDDVLALDDRRSRPSEANSPKSVGAPPGQS
jgi:RNA polymerase sigma-70 factor, ECF subfamily